MMATRPTKDSVFMAVAYAMATRSTCLRRAVGCVLVNARGHVLATGYNGVAAGTPHCNQPALDVALCNSDDVFPYTCLGAFAASGSALDTCEAIHAEQNALLQCRDVFDIDTCYTTTFPCVTCAKLLLNTGCRRIVYAELYDSEHMLTVGRLWAGAGRKLEHLS